MSILLKESNFASNFASCSEFGLGETKLSVSGLEWVRAKNCFFIYTEGIRRSVKIERLVLSAAREL